MTKTGKVEQTEAGVYNELRNNINIEVELKEDTGCGKSAKVQGRRCL